MDYSLYLVTNSEILKETKLSKAIKEAIKGGVSVVQLREKKMPYNEFLNLARKIKKITDYYNTPLIINDNIKIANEIDANGVHVGQNDDTLTKAREILGRDKIIGVSVSNLIEAKKAQIGGANYVGIGTIFFTSTKEDIKKPIGLNGLKKIASETPIAKVAIGGINLQNVQDVMSCGVDGVAVVSAILSSDNIAETSSQFLEKIEEIKWRK